MEYDVAQLAGIFALGMAGQYLAARTPVPAILALLVLGFLAGPVAGLIHPQELFGDIYSPFISMAVGVVLFEGGLGLDGSILRAARRTTSRLLTVGVTVTWIVATASIFLLADFGIELSVLTGAILVVSGPTVVLPLLREMRPTRPVDSILRSEGILVDPIGAVLAVLVLTAITSGAGDHPVAHETADFLGTIGVGVGFGTLGAALLVTLLRGNRIPTYLHSGMALAVVLLAFAAADTTFSEGGLVATTTMGILFANQKVVEVKRIIEFKESLGAMLTSVLFIVIAGSVSLGELSTVSMGSAVVLGALILVARPLAVALSSARSGLSWRERAMLAAVAPRGIIAASTASIASVRLSNAGVTNWEKLVPLVFIIIVGTVTIYGLAAVPLAKLLGVAQKDGEPHEADP